MEEFHNLAIGHIGALTAREQQVATLAKSGLSNKGKKASASLKAP